jgi:hypothetical protein
MRPTQDTGETHALIKECLARDSNCGYRQNDLRLNMCD